ncbi:MAG TPA: HEAT repeat domain-containing protein, partial [Planctomycetota bacterium]|nr:HEAT repeat domain-containing protein [Planctomycetota bacterium]
APDASAREILERHRQAPDPAAIREGLAHPSGAVRHEAAVRSYFHPDPSLRPALFGAADDPDLRVRLWAVAALGKTGHPQALEKLVSRLADPELFVRYRAAEGLGFLGDPGAVEPLLRLTRQGSWYEGLYALEALRMIDPARF